MKTENKLTLELTDDEARSLRWAIRLFNVLVGEFHNMEQHDRLQGDLCGTAKWQLATISDRLNHQIEDKS